MLTPPLSRSRTNDVCKSPGKGGLIGKSGLRRNIHQRAVRFGQKDLRDLHPAQSQVTMWGCPKRSPERSRKMAGRKPAFLGKCSQLQIAVQMLAEQLHGAPHLPRSQTAFELQCRFAKLTIPPHKVRTNRHGERVDAQ